eukprot:7449042-Pyramimonas_sp.AAC.1
MEAGVRLLRHRFPGGSPVGPQNVGQGADGRQLPSRLGPEHGQVVIVRPREATHRLENRQRAAGAETAKSQVAQHGLHCPALDAAAGQQASLGLAAAPEPITCDSGAQLPPVELGAMRRGHARHQLIL